MATCYVHVYTHHLLLLFEFRQPINSQLRSFHIVEQDANTSSEDYVLLDYSKGGHTASVSCIKFLPHSFGQKLVSGGGDCMLIGWDWLEACEGSHDPLPKLWSVNHHQKINCVDLRSTELIVADVEPDLTVYIAA